MKYFIGLLLVLVAKSSQAQITLEHTYPAPGGLSGESLIYLVQVDSLEWKYLLYNRIDSISVYNLDHTQEKIIIIPKQNQGKYTFNLLYFTRKLFNTDNLYEYVVTGIDQGSSSLPLVRIFNEKEELVFSCDTCSLNNFTDNILGPEPRQSIFSVNGITKMVITYGPSGGGFGKHEVYSLPGKLPGCSTTKSGVETPSVISGSGFTTSAYPNPSNGKVRIEYKLPEGVSVGEIIIADALGNEVKRYRVGNVFNDILIEKSDLASGSYFYKLVTDKGESEARKLVVLR